MAGGLRGDGGGAGGSFPRLRLRQPRHHPVRQVQRPPQGVIPKRTNRPGISSTDRGFPRGRFRGRGGGGFGSARSRFYSGFSRPRGRGYR
ncbi:polyadenylate-binding protein 2-like [Empidonax traillii]|uniref:polyadenylate-binding protein 2-like n=1 Tax=Empidonax traillii TaxID=164674 RepID=UPI000FFD2A00|nr:polyadenylate-binding protein 2-like [Empidonax traillii]